MAIQAVTPQPTLLQATRFLLLTVLTGIAAVSCVSLEAFYPQAPIGQEAPGPTPQEGPTNSGGDATGDSDGTAGADGGGTDGTPDAPPGETGENGAITGVPAPGDRPLFRVTEDYWLETPWFGVSSIIVVVRRTTPKTRIVVPEETLLHSTMRNADGFVESLPTDLRKDRIRVGVSFHIGDVPPFIDRDRYAHPEDYY